MISDDVVQDGGHPMPSERTGLRVQLSKYTYRYLTTDSQLEVGRLLDGF